MCSVENCELENFENNDKCIYHCDKKLWNHKNNCIELDNKLEYFWKSLNEYILLKNKNNENYVFNKFIFPSVGVFSFFDNKNSFDSINNKMDFYFKKCVFYGKSNFSIFNKLENITFRECEFKQGVLFESLEINGKFLFEENKAKSNIFFKRCTFNGTSSFIGSKFLSELNFYHVSFKKSALFNGVRIDDLLFENTYFESNFTFLKVSINKLSRETARIIKDSFEQQNNIIEANKYYALEMKEREKELNQDRKEGKNLLEWLVFKVHGLASNHSQDWLLSLFWILSFSFGYGFVNCINKYLDTKLEFMLIDIILFGMITLISVFVVESKRINNYILIAIFYLIYSFTSKDFSLFDISNNINPFSIMTGWQELSFLTLSYKIIIAYLIYQLIISIRQNTRRK
mgnify:CR=1 FL=1